MRRALIFGLACFLTTSQASFAQQGLALTIGAFSQSADFLRQALSVTNNSGHFYNFVTVECGFFDHGRLVATSSDLVKSLAPGTTGYGTATTYSATREDKIDDVKCRISGVM